MDSEQTSGSGQQQVLSKNYLKAKIVFIGTVTCETGLHIGGVEMGVDVGGIDKFVIRNPLNDQPYIPGSSIKGKIRSLLELATIPVSKLIESAGGIIGTMPEDAQVMGLFGKAIKRENETEGAANQGTAASIPNSAQTNGNTHGTGSKVLFRDAILVERPGLALYSNGLKFTERKAENVLTRIKLTATPRQIERVPAGTSFKFSMILNVDSDNQSKFVEQLELLQLGYQLLGLDGLGGMVSRGYGQVDIKWGKIEVWRVTNSKLTLEKSFAATGEVGIEFSDIIEYAKNDLAGKIQE
ncbi:MAG: type III-A CRISPR-associated RAMP protein Csm3 [Chloroflexi bacterium 54-19]|nr:MAG: type III-A CRISPR-associated RAMP protein Csm3 [Chloroflexi bacterium 54-19]